MRARRSARSREQVLERVGVVAEDGAFANAESAAAFHVNDVAIDERLGALVHGMFT